MKLKPISEIKANLGINPGGRVQRFFTDTCYKKMDKYVPMDTGDLSSIVDKGVDYITYEMPYAHYQYEGVSVNGKPLNYHTDKHPLATSHWDKQMWTAEGKDVVRMVQEEVRRRGNK